MTGVFPTPFTPSYRLADNNTLNTLLGNPIYSSQDGITAYAGGGQTNSVVLFATNSRITTVANAGDSVRLQPSTAGRIQIVTNDTATSMQIYGHDTATINDVASATGVAQAGNTTVMYICPIAGKWYSIGLSSGTFSGAFNGTVGATTPSTGVFTSISDSGNLTFTTIGAGIVQKRGTNGKVGTFVANGATPVTVSNTSIAITDTIIISLNTVGGTVGAVPAIQTITASTGFTVAATASDTSTYNYQIISSAV